MGNERAQRPWRGYLVRRPAEKSIITLAVTALVPILLGSMMWYARIPERNWILFPFRVSGALAGFSLILYTFGMLRRIWILPSQGGFRWRTVWRDRDIPFTDVSDVAFSVVARPELAGDHTYFGTLTLWLVPTAARPRRLRISTDWRQEGDPLTWLAQAAENSLAHRVNEQIAAGGAFEGDDWILTADRLALSNPRCELTLTDLIDGNVIQTDVTLWHRGQTEPITLPLAGRNVRVLWTLLRARLAARPAQPAEPAHPLDEYDLGRVLFHRQRNTPWIGLIALIILLVTGVGMIGPGSRWPPTRDTLTTLGVLTVLTVAVADQTILEWTASCSFHERGATQRSLMGKKQLLYINAGAMTYSVTRHYTNSQYQETKLRLRLTPAAGCAGQTIRLAARFKGHDAALERVRDRAATAIASRKLEELRECGRAGWIINVHFTPEGVRKSFLGIGPGFLFPYHRLDYPTFHNGVMTIRLLGQPNRVIVASVNSRDFWPGYILLRQLMSNPSLAQAPP